jgi:hypothetical protein
MYHNGKQGNPEEARNLWIFCLGKKKKMVDRQG